MAKSLSHPDCVHCRFMIHHKNGEYRCHQHNMTLHTPVSLFCKMIKPIKQKNIAYHQWFRDNINPKLFDANMLYTWIETPLQDAQDTAQIVIDAESIAPVTSYRQWSAGAFWQVLRDLRLAKQVYYRQQGKLIEKSVD